MYIANITVENNFLFDAYYADFGVVMCKNKFKILFSRKKISYHLTETN